MSSEQHESRLAKLKQLQEELQEQLLSQLSSINLEDDSVSEETRLEILRTLNQQDKDKIDYSRHQTISEAESSKNDSVDLENVYCTCKSPLKLPSPSLNIVEDLEAINDTTTPTEQPNLAPLSSNNDLHCNETDNESKNEHVDISNASDSTRSPNASGSLPFIDHSSHPTKPSEVETNYSPNNNHHQIEQTSDTLSNGRNTFPVLAHQSPPYYQKSTFVSPQKDVNGVSSTIPFCDECVGLKAHIDRLLTENTQWKVECCKLEEHIEECLSINKNFMEKNNRLMRRMANYQEECESKEQLVSVLQSRITSLSEQLKHHEQHLQDAKERNNELEEELGCCIREKKDLKELFHQTSSELDSKVNELTRVELKLKAVDVQLFNSNSEIHRLKQALSIAAEKENQFHSTIYNLEEEIQTLRHMNNRLNSHATHFQTSDEAPPPAIMYNNVSDESKLTSPRVGTPSHKPFEQSPRNVSEDSSTQQRLTKRKWLETSEGGLVFGTPSQSKENKENDLNVYSPPCTPVVIRSSPNTTRGGNPAHHRYSAPVDTAALYSHRGARSSERGISGRQTKSPREKIDERVQERLRQVPIVENRLVELQKEKEKLEKILNKAPSTGKVTTQSKKMMNDAEKRLDEVLKEIGAARLYLWKKR